MWTACGALHRARPNWRAKREKEEMVPPAGANLRPQLGIRSFRWRVKGNVWGQDGTAAF